jgi:hypothetical protein
MEGPPPPNEDAPVSFISAGQKLDLNSLTEERAIEMVRQALCDFGFNPYQYTIEFSDTLDATACANAFRKTIQIHSLKDRASHILLSNERLFKYVAYHEVGHIKDGSRLGFMVGSCLGVLSLVCGLLFIDNKHGLSDKLAVFVEQVTSVSIPTWLPMMLGSALLGWTLPNYLFYRDRMSREHVANCLALDKLVEKGDRDTIGFALATLLLVKEQGDYRADPSHPPVQEEYDVMVKHLDKKGLSVIMEMKKSEGSNKELVVQIVDKCEQETKKQN